MSAVAASPQKTCRRCRATIGGGESLHGYCLPCLLNPALKFNPTVDLAKINRFAPYAIATHPDGSFVELGRGSMGTTYRATDTNLSLPVALKVINLKVAGQEVNWERFLREARAAASLSHPHVVRVLYYGIAEDGQCYYAMELVEGATLAERVRRSGPLPVSDALEVIAQVASALDAAEKQSLVHRDLKPANLMLLNSSGINIKVIDFGLAKIIGGQESGDPANQDGFIGTPAFASPEQFSGDQVDQRSDYFSLGGTLYFLLTGNAPFNADTVGALAEQINHLQPVLSELKAARVPSPVRRLIGTLLTASPENRPQNGSALVQAIKKCRRAIAIKRFGLKAAIITAIVVALVIPTISWLQNNGFFSGDTGAKSIAVLPFDDLSPAKADSFFTDGIQDDILADLAKIADLQVISRSSVNGYRGTNRPLPPEIGRALNVRYLLNGSVQRQGNRIRVTAQLEDTRTGRELWADRYDGELTDVFAIQAELAEAISQELRAKLSSAEKSSLEDIPTRDFGAYELYLHAKEIWTNYDANIEGSEPLDNVIRLLDEAVSRDPTFALAWSRLASAHDYCYRLHKDPIDSHRAAAENALEIALRLRPDLGEVHLAAGFHLMATSRDYSSIRRELEIARRTLPNSAYLLNQLANVDRLQGKWGNALEDYKKEAKLDPKDMRVKIKLYDLYTYHRQYDLIREISKDIAATGPRAQSIDFRTAETAWDEKGDTSAFHSLFDEPTGSLHASAIATVAKIICAFADRNYSAAEKSLDADPRQEFETGRPALVCRDWLLGWIKKFKGDEPAAKVAFSKARQFQLAYVQKSPDDPNQLMVLALADAALGHKEDALREGRQAISLKSIARDAVEGPLLANDLAEVYVLAGQKELAIKQLESLKEIPRALTFGDLAKSPDWDPLRDDARFQKLLSRLKPIPILNRGNLAKQ
jgi:eukaryotic-like serine/threonine-protein kinase